MSFLCDIFYDILGWRWDVVIQWQVAASTTHRGLGTSCAMQWFGTISKAKSVGLLNFFATITNLPAVLLW
jgi:hypothetical protein